jgi:TPR repeat protein
MVIFKFPMVYLILTGVLLSRSPADNVPLDLSGLKEKSAAGDPNSQFALGRAYLRGEGTIRDIPEAYQLLRTASESGHMEARGAYGFMIAKGMGTTTDEKAGFALIQEAAGAGIVSAVLNEGIMTMKGQGTVPDAAAGMALIEKAAKQGHLEAQIRMAEIYFLGQDGIAAAPEKAVPWAQQAAEAGSAWALTMVGTMKEHAKGMPRDIPGARDAYLKAAQLGSAKAQSALGRLLYKGIGVEQDPVRAFYWLSASAIQGEITASRFLEETKLSFTAEQIKLAQELQEREPAPQARQRRNTPSATGP